MTIERTETRSETLHNFDAWMRLVDAAIERRCGMSAFDLPDVCYRDWYEDDLSPARAAARAIRYANE